MLTEIDTLLFWSHRNRWTGKGRETMCGGGWAPSPLFQQDRKLCVAADAIALVLVNFKGQSKTAARFLWYMCGKEAAEFSVP
jgi:hypothetical protein